MLQPIQAFLDTLPLRHAKILVGVSGGVDSLVLLCVLHDLREHYGYELHAATLDHQLRGTASAQDADFVCQFADSLGVECSKDSQDAAAYAQAEALNLEAAARQLRYTFLVQTALQHGAAFVAVGHHQDDQAETLLMHLIRGAGMAGLRGMLPQTPFSPTHLPDPDLLENAQDLTLLRPLLGVTRAEIAAYAAQMGITPRQDASNNDPAYLRNRVRHSLLPLLQTLNPNIRDTLARTATILQGDYAIVESTVSSTAARLVEWDETQDEDGNPVGEAAFIDRADFLNLSQGLQRQLLRHILQDLSDAETPYHHIDAACHLVADGGVGRQLPLPADVTLLLGYDELIIYYGGNIPFPRHIPRLPRQVVVPLALVGEKHLSDHWRFYSYWVVDGRSQELRRADPLEATLAIPPDAVLELRTRRPGDRFCPLGMGGRSQKLADTFTNLKIPRSLRDRVPLLLINGEIAWFVAPTAHGLQGRVAEPFAVRPHSASVLRVRWQLESG